jgi:hypothetical protein
MAGALLALGGAAPAHAMVTMQVNAVSHRGYISLFVVTSPELTDVTINEELDGELRELARPAMTYAPDTPDYGDVNYGEVADITRWKCTRRVRKLVAVARSSEGKEERGTYTVRTPSCANRLTLRVRPGRVTVRDTWGQGGVTATLCTPRRCRRVQVPKGRASLKRRLHIHRGDRVELRSRYQRLVHRVGVRSRGGPPVLVTGDSLMQSLDTILQDRLAHRADVTSDVRPGAALSRDVGVNWLALARKQVARHHPQATVVFLGANDAYSIDGVPCCGPAWGLKYEQRARTVMETYAQDGAGSVVWIAIPLPREERRQPAATAVNAAVRRAAANVPGTSILPADDIFTPGGEYRDTMPYKGRQVKVREADGLHLTLAGAAIAADYVISLLKQFAVV